MHADGEPLIVRTVPRGGAEITETHRDPARHPTGRGRGAQVPGRPAQRRRTGDRRASIRDAVRPLINEIRSSFAYLTTGDRQAQVARLALSGGGALLPGLVTALGNQLSVEVSMADPTTRFTGSRKSAAVDDTERFRSEATVSIGLALGAFQ